MEGEAAATPEKKGLLGKPVVLIGLIVVIMLIEFVVLYVFLPRPAAAQETADVKLEAETNASTVEVAIDSFNTTNTSAAPGTVIHLTFKLSAVVESSYASEFEIAVTTNHKARLREVVLKVARSATLQDINDPGLATFKRQVREEMNKVLRKSLVVEIVVSEFRAIEQ